MKPVVLITCLAVLVFPASGCTSVPSNAAENALDIAVSPTVQPQRQYRATFVYELRPDRSINQRGTFYCSGGPTGHVNDEVTKPDNPDYDRRLAYVIALEPRFLELGTAAERIVSTCGGAAVAVTDQ